jgi:hypothetical protein
MSETENTTLDYARDAYRMALSAEADAKAAVGTLRESLDRAEDVLARCQGAVRKTSALVLRVAGGA